MMDEGMGGVMCSKLGGGMSERMTKGLGGRICGLLEGG